LVNGKRQDLTGEFVSGVEYGLDFNLPVEFYCASPESEITNICLVFQGDSEKFPISGFPRALQEKEVIT
jgi:hypothetical protein